MPTIKGIQTGAVATPANIMGKVLIIEGIVADAKVKDAAAPIFAISFLSLSENSIFNSLSKLLYNISENRNGQFVVMFVDIAPLYVKLL